jgi:hypothetical protein
LDASSLTFALFVVFAATLLGGRTGLRQYLLACHALDKLVHGAMFPETHSALQLLVAVCSRGDKREEYTGTIAT